MYGLTCYWLECALDKDSCNYSFAAWPVVPTLLSQINAEFGFPKLFGTLFLESHFHDDLSMQIWRLPLFGICFHTSLHLQEEKKAKEEKDAIIAAAKKRGAEKAKLTKSLIIMDVKPWDDTTGESFPHSSQL
jgi:hypothetical protein